MPGRSIVICSWTGNLLFALTAIPAAAGVDVFDTPAIVVALVLFALSIVVWMWAFGVAVVRSARGDDIVVGNMFVTVGDAARRVRYHLYGSLAVCLAVTIGTAAAEPFGVLVPMLPLGFVGLWSARHGTFPPRREPLQRRA